MRTDKKGPPMQPGEMVKPEKTQKVGGVEKAMMSAPKKTSNPIHRLGDYAHPKGGYKGKKK